MIGEWDPDVSSVRSLTAIYLVKSISPAYQALRTCLVVLTDVGVEGLQNSKSKVGYNMGIGNLPGTGVLGGAGESRFCMRVPIPRLGVGS